MPVAADPWWLLVAVLALGGLATFAFAVRALDLLGSFASFLLGLLVALAGGLGWMLLMVVFTGLGFVATRVGYGRKKRLRVAEDAEGERGIRNVLGNGAAAGIVVLVGLVRGVPAAAVGLAFATALAAVAADTLASELGVLSARARNILPPFGKAKVGANGGVSWAGQGAALVGAILIAAASVPLVGVPWTWAWLPAVAGFVGCQVDSVLGAMLEGEPSRPGPLGKQDVNFLASLLPALAVLALAWWL
ncbi:MAG: DUF92 domain-containing protein [Thermoplasmatota archaeon]|nr:DUF92 domain-containing protein [Halobacteriales archaeon]